MEMWLAPKMTASPPTQNRAGLPSEDAISRLRKLPATRLAAWRAVKYRPFTDRNCTIRRWIDSSPWCVGGSGVVATISIDDASTVGAVPAVGHRGPPPPVIRRNV